MTSKCVTLDRDISSDPRSVPSSILYATCREILSVHRAASVISVGYPSTNYVCALLGGLQYHDPVSLPCQDRFPGPSRQVCQVSCS